MTQAFAQANDSKPNANTNASAAQQDQAVAPQVLTQVRDLTAEIDETKSELDELDRKIARSKKPDQREALTADRDKLQGRLDDQISTLEQIATGAVDLSLFEQPSEQEFSWQAELREVLKPLLYEVKKLTEKPRQLELLRTRSNSLEIRLEASNLAIAEIESLRAAVESKEVIKTLDKLLGEWRDRREDIDSELSLVTYQLNEKASGEQSKAVAIANAFTGFFTGRGLNVLLAIAVFVVTFLLFRYLSHLLERWISRGQDAERRFFARLVHIVLQVFSVLFATFALMATLYALGDWLMLTLLLIVLVGIVFALRDSLPRFVDEARLLLNLSAVREGERVVYQGLPWKVSRLNIYSNLVNPLLTGGRLRLPMSEMLPLISRRWSKDERWFPCKPKEYVVLSDDTFGCIKLQTPEFVHLQVLGGAIKSYATTDFLALSPRNLSEGFGVFISFGLDYALQQKITEEIPARLEQELEQAVNNSKFGEHLEQLRVEFEAAGASSLNLLMIAFFSGKAAANYRSIQRFLQRAAVDASNKHNWNIPFDQLTVHMDN
ncbi:MAG: hypothetical protein KJO24_06715 [Gammaproteobacteria bacterium]|nr:hypothetical protein [Gammaproteobacteria bacterium]